MWDVVRWHSLLTAVGDVVVFASVGLSVVVIDGDSVCRLDLAYCLRWVMLRCWLELQSGSSWCSDGGRFPGTAIVVGPPDHPTTGPLDKEQSKTRTRETKKTKKRSARTSKSNTNTQHSAFRDWPWPLTIRWSHISLFFQLFAKTSVGQKGICAECTCPKGVQALSMSYETTKRPESSPVPPHVDLRCRDVVPPEQLAVGEQRHCLDAELTIIRGRRGSPDSRARPRPTYLTWRRALLARRRRRPARHTKCRW